MKRMSPDRRGSIINDLVEKLKHEWLCRHGKWNQGKLLQELEQKLRSERLGKDG